MTRIATECSRGVPIKARGEGIEPSSPGSKPSGLPLADPRIAKSATTNADHAAHGARSVPGVEPTSPAWKAGTFAARPRALFSSRRKERESNPQGRKARPGSSGVPSPIGLTFQILSCGGRNRTCVVAVNSRLPVPARAPPHQSVRTVGFEPTFSGSRNRRIPRLSYVLNRERHDQRRPCCARCPVGARS